MFISVCSTKPHRILYAGVRNIDDSGERVCHAPAPRIDDASFDKKVGHRLIMLNVVPSYAYRF